MRSDHGEHALGDNQMSADDALYQAKRAGRNQVQMSDPG